MHTFQISGSVLEGYKNEKLSQERVDALLVQVNQQLDEISQNSEVNDGFLKQINAPQNIDKIILWILLMSNEDLCCEYISKFDKDYREIIPVSDLADLLLYTIYLKKVKDIELEGFEYLLGCEKSGIGEIDQYAFTNVLLYIQKLKEGEIEF